MKREFFRHFDFWLFGAVILLCIFGVAMMRSAAAGNEEILALVPRQTIFVLIGLAVLLFTTVIDYHFWESISWPMYFVLIVMLIIIWGLGKATFGAARWLDIGIVDIQPAELSKIVIILVLASSFNKHRNDPRDLRWVIRSFVITGGMAVWIVIQPNLSNTIVLMVMWFAMMWLAGLPPKFIPIFIATAIVLALVAFPFIENYQQQRVITFLFPDPNASYGNNYNVDQARITIGSGGLFGEGYGHSTQVQLRFLKVRHTDFIFASMAAEFGFVGTVGVIGLLVFVIFRVLRAAKLASDTFGAFICYGFGILLFFQTAVNIGVNLNVIPVTGLTLPFISSGGSSAVSMLLGIGMVESVLVRQKILEF